MSSENQKNQATKGDVPTHYPVYKPHESGVCTVCSLAVEQGYTPIHGYIVTGVDHDPDPAPKETAVNYPQLGKDLGSVVARKQREYGDSFGRAGHLLRSLYPTGISVGQYDDVLCLVRIIDKLFRIATDCETDEEDPYMDIAGYGLLGHVRSVRKREGR